LDYEHVAARFANEGVPINVIARGLEVPAAEVRIWLNDALHSGRITEMPAVDWPPSARRADRLPPHIAAARDADLTIACMRAFHITKLQAHFMLVLVKREEADKHTLHRVIESQRAQRASRLDDNEETDPKMVDVVICHLRKKLKPFGLIIHTLWGYGYYLDAAGRQQVLSVVEKEVDGARDLNDNAATRNGNVRAA